MESLRRLSLRSILVVTAIILFVSISDHPAFSSQSSAQTQRYVHHEYLYGTARIDYVELVDGEGLITQYYRYEDPRDAFRVTSVEIYNGTKYQNPRPVRIVRYVDGARDTLGTSISTPSAVCASPQCQNNV